MRNFIIIFLLKGLNIIFVDCKKDRFYFVVYVYMYVDSNILEIYYNFRYKYFGIGLFGNILFFFYKFYID